MRKSEEEELLERISCYTHSTSNNITINNITNINVSGCRNPNWHGRRGVHGNRHRKSERPPKLTRHCASLGMLDEDIAYGMGTEERMREGVKVMAYGVRVMGRDISKISSNAKGIVSDLFGAASCFVDCVVCLGRAVACAIDE